MWIQTSNTRKWWREFVGVYSKLDVCTMEEEIYNIIFRTNQLSNWNHLLNSKPIAYF